MDKRKAILCRLRWPIISTAYHSNTTSSLSCIRISIYSMPYLITQLCFSLSIFTMLFYVTQMLKQLLIYHVEKKVAGILILHSSDT